MKGRIAMQQKADHKQAQARYAALVKRLTPKSKLGQGCLRSFWVGGVICMLGQALADAGHAWLELSTADASAFASIVLIFLTALLTGIGVFDKIARYAGAGTVVPITGFANAMASPALEFKTEGKITGTAAKMFVIAGPVIVFGVSAGAVCGLVFWLKSLL